MWITTCAYPWSASAPHGFEQHTVSFDLDQWSTKCTWIEIECDNSKTYELKNIYVTFLNVPILEKCDLLC